MHPKFIRIGLLLAALTTSLTLAAAPRFWTLTDAKLEDGAVVTGYFSFDDATWAISNFHIRLAGGATPFLPWSVLPGAVHPWSPQPLYLYTYAPNLVPDPYVWRSLVITPVGPLDGSSSAVLIDIANSPDFFEDDLSEVSKSRKFVAGSLVLSPPPPPPVSVQVDEFYHPGLLHYFMTADTTEKHLLDTGVYSGWKRTGESFKAYATGSSSSSPWVMAVCRYYGLPEHGLDSHFYAGDLPECTTVFAKLGAEWQYESENVFQIDVPNRLTGECLPGMVPVYRLWNQRADSNHRYTTKTAIKAQMIASGYVAEGFGTNGVVMCAVQ